MFLLVPNPDYPKDLLRRSQRLARVLQLMGLIRWHAARIPQVAAIFCQQGCRGCHQDAIGRLPRASPAVFCSDHDPTEARRGHVHPQRVDAIFAAQPFRLRRGLRREGGNCKKKSECDEMGYLMDRPDYVHDPVPFDLGINMCMVRNRRGFHCREKKWPERTSRHDQNTTIRVTGHAEVFKGLCTCAWQDESYSSSKNPAGRQSTQHTFTVAGTNLL